MSATVRKCFLSFLFFRPKNKTKYKITSYENCRETSKWLNVSKKPNKVCVGKLTHTPLSKLLVLIQHPFCTFSNLFPSPVFRLDGSSPLKHVKVNLHCLVYLKETQKDYVSVLPREECLTGKSPACHTGDKIHPLPQP